VAPNPASGGSCFHYEQREPGRAEIAIYTIGGRKVAAVSATARGTASRGEDVLCWDGKQGGSDRSIASGVYVWELVFNGSVVPGQKGAMTVIR
jgi:hypothetical protein